jgi:hypothetical protein
MPADELDWSTPGQHDEPLEGDARLLVLALVALLATATVIGVVISLLL